MDDYITEISFFFLKSLNTDRKSGQIFYLFCDLSAETVLNCTGSAYLKFGLDFSLVLRPMDTE